MHFLRRRKCFIKHATKFNNKVPDIGISQFQTESQSMNSQVTIFIIIQFYWPLYIFDCIVNFQLPIIRECKKKFTPEHKNPNRECKVRSNSYRIYPC